jgi:hypothetical protein
MVRRIGAIAAALAVFAALEFAAAEAAKAFWPDYALAAPTRAYTFSMLLARLTAGSMATFAGGALAGRLDRSRREAALVFGIVLLTLSVVWHIKIWNLYPVWYHLGWFACIVPSAVLGGLCPYRHYFPLGAPDRD